MDRLLALLTTAIVIAGLTLPSATAQGPGGLSQDFAGFLFTSAEANLTNDLAVEVPLEALAPNGTGTQATKLVSCPQGSCGEQVLGVWVVQQALPYGAAFPGSAQADVLITPADNPPPPLNALPIPVPTMLGSGRLILQVSSTNPEGNPHLHTASEVSLNLGPTTGTQPMTVSFDLPLDGWSVAAGHLVFFTLRYIDSGADETGPTYFQVVYDQGSNSQITSMPYTVGEAGATDLDGDGIPDGFDTDRDGDGISNANETALGSNPDDANSRPDTDDDGDGFANQDEAAAETDPQDASSFPDEGGFPWGLLLLLLVALILLAAGGLLVARQVTRKVDVEVSEEGFASVEKGQEASFEVAVINRTKKAEVDARLTVENVPEGWTAAVKPDRVHLEPAGDEQERDRATAALVVAPPPDEEYEAEAIVQIVAQPIDEEGEASGPAAKAKAKTIVNIGVESPEGTKKKRLPFGKKKAAGEEGEAEAEEGEEKPKKRFGFGRKKKEVDAPEEEPGEEAADEAEEEPKKKRFGFGRKKKPDEPAEGEASEEAVETAEEKPKKKRFGLGRKKDVEAAEAEPAGDEATAEAAAAAAPEPGKPQLHISKLSHDPENFRRGDTVKSTVTVTNEGKSPVSGLKLSLFVNDAETDSKTVDVKPGKSKSVTFKWTAQPEKNKLYVRGDLT